MTERDIFFQNLGLPSRNPLAIKIVKADGIYIFDEKNQPIVDLCSGVSVSNIGHNHPKVVQAVVEQAQKYMHLHVYGEIIQSPQVQFAKLITSILPLNLDTVYFVNSGSEATEGAIKLAKRYTGRYEIASFKKAYHGSTIGALSVLGDDYWKQSFLPLMPCVNFLEFNNHQDLLKITEQTAAVIVEPIQAEAGVVLPQNDFLKKLRQRCNQTGTLLIFDEVQTGFGRTGKLFAMEHYDVVPDIITFAKAMGGGMPIGAFVSSHKIMEAFQFAPELGHITTFGGHPVSAAAGLAALDFLLNSSIIEEVKEKENIFRKNLTNSKIKSINGIGLLLAVELQDPNTVNKFLNLAVNNGLLTDAFLFAPNKFRIAPPLTISNNQIEQVCQKINLILEKLKK